jgi:hypothetical protein
MDEPKIPRMKVVGDTCSTCGKRTELNDFLIKIRVVTYTGYLDTEICFECMLSWKKDSLKAALT